MADDLNPEKLSQAATFRLDRAHPQRPSRLAQCFQRAPTRRLLARQHDPGLTIWGEVPDMRVFLAAADCVIAPLQIARGVQNKVLEAMAIGRAIITTDAPGCRETIRHEKSGMLIPVADVKGLVQAIQRYIESPELIDEHGAAARARAEDVYDVTKVNRDMLRGLQDLA